LIKGGGEAGGICCPRPENIFFFKQKKSRQKSKDFYKQQSVFYIFPQKKL